MRVEEAILKRRSVRRFKQERIPFKTLEKLVGMARLAPSGANLQPWHFIIVDDQEIAKQIFSCTRWAGYLEPRWTPAENERPAAYIVVLVDSQLEKEWTGRDMGAAVENILLAALEEGINSCWLGALRRKKIMGILSIPDRFRVDSVIALGLGQETSVVEEMKDSVRYWRDKEGILHVPKRSLADMLHKNKF